MTYARTAAWHQAYAQAFRDAPNARQLPLKNRISAATIAITKLVKDGPDHADPGIASQPTTFPGGVAVLYREGENASWVTLQVDVPDEDAAVIDALIEVLPYPVPPSGRSGGKVVFAVAGEEYERLTSEAGGDR